MADGARTSPFFLFLHLYEPHTPYAPPEPFASRYAGRPYDGEIATADAIVGGVLAELKEQGIYDRAIDRPPLRPRRGAWATTASRSTGSSSTARRCRCR